jgi:hypothetical protein
MCHLVFLWRTNDIAELPGIRSIHTGLFNVATGGSLLLDRPSGSVFVGFLFTLFLKRTEPPPPSASLDAGKFIGFSCVHGSRQRKERRSKWPAGRNPWNLAPSPLRSSPFLRTREHPARVKRTEGDCTVGRKEVRHVRTSARDN